VTSGGPIATELRLLALGDSYSIGEAVAEAGRWPVRLAALLREHGIPTATPDIIAKTGWTTDELSHGIDAAQLNGSYDLVSLLIGVNNQYRGRPVEEYRAQFRDLLARAIAFARKRPDRAIVLSIPDWSVTPFAASRDRARIAAEIDAFNTANYEEALLSGARYVDVTPISRCAAIEPELVAHDGLHPSAAMYERWANLVLAEAMRIVGAR
jgi:lysophospholipase L1-like esterase